MLSEREIVSVAFGNYSSLVAAQWANGTSHYDAHHQTLYSECRASDVLGGNGGDSEGSAVNQRTRVPRLLLLDAPYASTFDDVQIWEAKYDAQQAQTGEEDEEGGRAKANARRYVDVSSSSAASVLWSKSNNLNGARNATSSAAERETQRLAGVAQAVQQHMWAQHGLDEDDDGSGEEGNESEEGEEDDYTRLRRELGIAPYGLDTGDERHDDTEEEAEDTTHNNMAHRKLTKQDKVAKLKRKIFDTHNTVIPWWQYITTGLAARSVTSVKPLQHVDAAGDIPALHSFGYGVKHLHPDKGSEVAALSDALRAQLESADQLQGVQCFIDADGMFGGAAANVLEQFWEEAGSKTSVVNVGIFTPLPDAITDRKNASEVAFRERRLDEAALNQLLATLELSRHTSAVYVPLPLAQWGDFFRGSATATSQRQTPAWLQDERATAQYIAAIVDTALYGARDGNNTHLPASKRGRDAAADDTTLRTQGPMYYMDDWCRVVRPAPSLRMAAAMGALPLPLSQSSELWQFLESTPLLPGAPVFDDRMACAQADEGNNTTALKTGFVPLTHAMSSLSPLHSSGQVLGHAVSLRGAGVLPSTVFPTREALLRYALPLGTSTYLPLMTESNYPISATFPMELMFSDPAATARQLPRGLGSLRDALKSVDVGAHVLSTYASAPMLHDIVDKAKAALRFKMDRYCVAYDMEKDDWQETIDEGLAMFDDYHHAAPASANGSDDGNDGYY